MRHVCGMDELTGDGMIEFRFYIVSVPSDAGGGDATAPLYFVDFGVAAQVAQERGSSVETSYVKVLEDFGEYSTQKEDGSLFTLPA